MKVAIFKDELYPHYIIAQEWNGGHSGVEIELTDDEFNRWREAQGMFYEMRELIEEKYEASSNS